MHKPDLADLVYGKIEGLQGSTKKLSNEIVDMVFDKIVETLKSGQEVAIAGFGVFKVKDRKARTARNPKTGAPVQVPASKVPKFRPAKPFKEAIK